MKLNSKKFLQMSVLSIIMLTTGLFTTTAYASTTGFVQSSSAISSPYGFTWNSTNGAALDATNSTQGMLEFNYAFYSGSDWSVDLGKPTTYNGTVNIDVYNANVRADKNVSVIPPSYGIYSGEFMTNATNPYFTQPVNANYWYVNVTNDANGLTIYDTLQQGVNFQQSQSSGQGEISVNPSGASGFLTPTSLQ